MLRLSPGIHFCNRKLFSLAKCPPPPPPTFSSLLCSDFTCTYAEHEIRTVKCSDTCQHMIKFVLTFAKNDQMLVEICTVALYFGSDKCQIKLGQPKSTWKMSDVRLLFHALYVYVTKFWKPTYVRTTFTL